MGDILQLKNRLDSFNVDGELRRIVFDLEKKIVKLNTDNLFQGKDSEGKLIGVYSPATEVFSKGRSGKGFPKIAFKPYNLFDSGKLFDSVVADYEDGGKLAISSVGDLSKVFSTIKKHGLINNPQKTLFGLTVNKKEILNFQLLLPELQSRFKNITGL